MKNSVVLVFALLTGLSAFAQKKKDLIKEVAKLKAEAAVMQKQINAIEESKKLDLKDSIQNFSYAYGVNLGSNLKTIGVDSISYNAFAMALKDVLNGNEKVTVDYAQSHVQNTMQKIIEVEDKVRDEKNTKFLEKNAKRSEVITTDSGLQYEVLTKGEGAIPMATDKVKVHYKGMLIDGKQFDSSIERGEPAVFGVSQVIKGWQEALQLMPIGSKYIVYIPQDLAYGDRGVGNGLIPAFSALIFEMELLGIEDNK